MKPNKRFTFVIPKLVSGSPELIVKDILALCEVEVVETPSRHLTRPRTP